MDPERPRVTFNRAQQVWQIKSQYGLTYVWAWVDAVSFARFAALPRRGAPNFYGDFWEHLMEGRA